MTRRRPHLLVTTSALAVLALVPPLLGDAASASDARGTSPKATTVRISVKPNGQEVPGAAADYPAISANGRFVAFESFGKLLPKDSGSGDLDIYVYDRVQKKLELVSLKSNGDDGVNLEGERPDISANGRWVTFASEDPLVPSDDNGLHDIYRYDRQSNSIKLVSRTDTGALVTGMDNDSFISGVSDNGRFVAWESRGAFVAGDANTELDVFVRDVQAGTTVRASVDSDGVELPFGGRAGRDSQLALSGNGRFVAFEAFDTATEEEDFGFAVDTDVFVRDLVNDKTSRASLTSADIEPSSVENVVSRQPSISADGRFVAFSSGSPFVGADDNDRDDIYVRDRKEGITQRISVKSNGDEVDTYPSTQNSLPTISAGGRYVVWETSGDFGGPPETGSSFRDVYRRDRKTKKTVLVSLKTNGGHPDAEHQLSAVSADGRWVAFSSMGAFTNGDDPVDFDVFLRGPIIS